MKLAVSNIAWSREEEPEVASLLVERGIAGVEIAPTAVWPDPLAAGREAWHAHRAWWQGQGIAVVSLQSLLFGHPEMALFTDDVSGHAMLAHLTGLMELGAAVGAVPLVFGSPKNRTVGHRDRIEAWVSATHFFAVAGARAEDRGVCLCIEPNPTAYQCDFVNTVAEGIALVRAVSHAGFGLHVDAGAIAMNREPIAETISAAAPFIRHFHASEPFLAPLGTTNATDHAALAAALRDVGYTGWVSLEMRAPHNGLDGLRRSLDVLVAHYGD